jgi:hypothetical protein
VTGPVDSTWIQVPYRFAHILPPVLSGYVRSRWYCKKMAKYLDRNDFSSQS